MESTQTKRSEQQILSLRLELKDSYNIILSNRELKLKIYSFKFGKIPMSVKIDWAIENFDEFVTHCKEQQ